MLNRIVLTGRLTRDPEFKRSESDVGKATFTLAVDDTFKNAEGERTTSFINIVVFNNQAESVAKSLRKGSLVGVDGRIRQRTFERKKDGVKISVIEVIANQVEFLEPKGTREIPNEEMNYDEEEDDSIDQIEESKNLDEIQVADDDLPF